MSRTRVVFGIGALVIVSLAATSVHYYQQASGGARLFSQVAGRIDQLYVDSIGQGAVYEKAALGLVEQLKDPYSELLPPKEVEDFDRTVAGKYGGIGALVESRAGKRTFITKVYPNTPAEAAGVLEGDQIIAVDSVSTVGWEMAEVTKRTKGDPGTKVRVTFQREGVREPIILTLTRALVHIPAVPYAMMVEPGIGYVPLQQFNETAADEVTASVRRLVSQGAKSMILDLRGNPGGILGQALEISSLFLKPGQPIVSVRGRNGTLEADSAEGPRLEAQLPLVVLSDESSASASEIVAGALQDHDRALVIGARSFGKGLVQQTWQVGDGYLLKLTTGKWYTPSGRSIHRDRVLQPDGRFVETPVDTVKHPLPKFKSDAGRTVLGGGGVIPDLTVAQDTIPTTEQDFYRVTAPQSTLLNQALSEEALKHKGQVKPNFLVDTGWLTDIYRKLDSAGVKIEPRLVAARQTVLTRELGRRIARVAFSDSGQARREFPLDDQLMRAVSLLKGSATQVALFDAAKQKK